MLSLWMFIVTDSKNCPTTTNYASQLLTDDFILPQDLDLQSLCISLCLSLSPLRLSWNEEPDRKVRGWATLGASVHSVNAGQAALLGSRESMYRVALEGGTRFLLRRRYSVSGREICKREIIWGEKILASGASKDLITSTCSYFFLPLHLNFSSPTYKLLARNTSHEGPRGPAKGEKPSRWHEGIDLEHKSYIPKDHISLQQGEKRS